MTEKRTRADGPDARSSGSGGADETETNRVLEMRVSTDGMLLAATLEATPETVVETEQLVPMDDGTAPYVWVDSEDFAGFERGAASDPTVESLRAVADLGDGRLYRLRWTESEADAFEWIKESGAALLEGAVDGRRGTWRLKLRFESQAAVSAFRCESDERGIGFELLRLYDLTEAKTSQYNVTEKQHDAILTAKEMGYYDIPRSVTLEDVAEELGVSSAAASERLRRGQINLVNNTLEIGTPTGLGLREAETIDDVGKPE